MALGCCQNFISAQYLVNELMAFDQILHMHLPSSDIGWDCYISILANFQLGNGA